MIPVLKLDDGCNAAMNLSSYASLLRVPGLFPTEAPATKCARQRLRVLMCLDFGWSIAKDFFTNIIHKHELKHLKLS